MTEVAGAEVGVLGDATFVLQCAQRVLEPVGGHAVDDLAVHLDQPPVGVPGEALVAGPGGQALGRLVVETQVEDRVHHPRHRDGGARADGDEQGIGVVPEPLAGPLFEGGQVLIHLGLEPFGNLAARVHVGAARVGGDREAGRNGNPELRHLGEAHALAAEQLASAVGGLVEVVDVARRAHEGGESSHMLVRCPSRR